jgi:fatty acid CoA ligase FadD9
VLLREAHDLRGLPVAVFRCDMILAETKYAGQLNLPDVFTPADAEPGRHRNCARLVLRARQSRQAAASPLRRAASRFHRRGDLHTRRADGGRVETFHVLNPYDDGVGLDEYVDWLIDAGYPIQRIAGYDAWLQRFDTALRALPDKQRQASLLPLMHNYQRPEKPIRGSMAPTDRFRAAVQDAKIGPDKDIPHVTAPVIVKYITDLQLLGLL